MILIYLIISLSCLAWLLRRDLSAIGQITFRGGWKLGLAILGLFMLQALLVTYAPGQTMFQMMVVVGSQTLLAFLIILNRHLPGAKLFALGIALNTMVMIANGGWMPITPETYQTLSSEHTVELQGRAPASKGIMLSQHETNLWFLSDIIPVDFLGHNSAMSIGDVLILAGIAQFLLLAAPQGRPLYTGRASQVNTSP